MASTTTTYPDSLFFNALLAKIEAATSFIESNYPGTCSARRRKR